MYRKARIIPEMPIVFLKAYLVKQLLNWKLLSIKQAFILSYWIHLIDKGFYKLVKDYKPLQEDIPEFMEGFLEYSIKQPPDYEEVDEKC